MEKQKRNLLIMIGVLAILLVTYFALDRYNKRVAAEEAEAAEVQTDTAFSPVTDAGEVVKYTYTAEDVTYTLVKTDGVWTLETAEPYEVDQEDAQKKADILGNLQCYNEVGSDLNLEDFGLGDGCQKVTWETENGKYEVLLGNYNATIGYHYLAMDGTVYTVNDDPHNAFRDAPKQAEEE